MGGVVDIGAALGAGGVVGAAWGATKVGEADDDGTTSGRVV
jgi:hypothetical protein